MSGVELIAAERRRQVEAEGWTPEHDDDHTRGELACAAACYAIPEQERTATVTHSAFSVALDVASFLWPWWNTSYRSPRSRAWWKPVPNDRVRELVKAGALIAAEIDRLQREALEGKRPTS